MRHLPRFETHGFRKLLRSIILIKMEMAELNFITLFETLWFSSHSISRLSPSFFYIVREKAFDESLNLNKTFN